MNNPIELIKMMTGKMNPQQMAMNLLGQNPNPIMQNLIQMAQKGDKAGVERFARNMFKEQGRNFDQEYNDFMKSLK